MKTSYKKLITIVLAVILAMGTVFVFSPESQAAQTKCSHKKTFTDYLPHTEKQHYKVITCKSCRKELNRTKQNHTFGKWYISKRTKTKHVYTRDCKKCVFSYSEYKNHEFNKKGICKVCKYKKK